MNKNYLTLELLAQARQIAETEDVSSPPHSVVLFSTSYLETEQNKLDAFKYVKEHPGCYTLGDTKCGKILVNLDLEVDYTAPNPALMEIWDIASRRFLEAASGDIKAFVTGSDPRSTFRRIELPLLLKNSRVLTVNGINKFDFASQFL